MKRITFLVACIFATSFMFAQQQDKAEYDKWSIDLSGGLHKASRPYTTGYHSPTFGPWNAQANVRYMFNDKFGLRLGAGYNNIQEGDGAVSEFETKYYHTTLEGVVNLGNLLDFKEWTQNFGLLFHGGAGLAQMNLDDNAVYAEEDDYMSVFTAGVTPQLKLSESIAIFADLSIFGNVNQDYTWDGNEKTLNRGFDGLLTNISAGITFYIGGEEKHADWIDTSDKAKMTKELDSLHNRLAKIEDDMLDGDMDGVPNYLDREPNTPNGVTVDSKGYAIDKNENGIPDEMESSLERHFATKEYVDNQSSRVGGNETIRDLINNGYVNVYFKFDSTQPEIYSLEAINYLATYMKANPGARAELIGYADEIGNAQYNEQLSERRAKKVYDILLSAGIEESRLEHRGAGVDDSVDRNSADARQLVRRVTFKLK